MEAKKEFLRMINECEEIALATSIHDFPNVRIVNYYYDEKNNLIILEKVGGIELDAARRVAGSGFYYLDRRYCKTTFSNINICKRFHNR